MIKDVKHIAKLARLGITDEEARKFEKDLSSVLGYIDSLNKVNVKRVEPTFHPSEHYFKKNVMREDISEDQEVADDLIKVAPDKKDRHIKVKSVF